jgi:LPXTG-motif cell wall-anchored protein
MSSATLPAEISAPAAPSGMSSKLPILLVAAILIGTVLFVLKKKKEHPGSATPPHPAFPPKGKRKKR